MRLNLFALVQNDAGVQAALGDAPMRLFPFGEADEQAGEGPHPAYATWQTIDAQPENYLSGRPDADRHRLQIDVWASLAADAEAAADALRNALELKGHQVSINLDGRDPETRLYRISFDFEFWQNR
jgi:hypothetical protein